jgi:CDP-diacylglycerol---glycerol-3-phosphate 3-phosphatidyltransferase
LSNSSIIAAIITAVMVSMVLLYAVRTSLVGRRQERRVEKVGGTVFVNVWVMESFYWAIRIPGRACARIGLKPDHLTWISLLLGLGALPAAALGRFSIAGGLVLACAIFDALDGMVARELGISSDAGEVLDAVTDRYADAAPLAGLIFWYRFSPWQMAIPFAALIGSMMVSYMRAKSEAMALKLPSGLMRRHERITYMVVALVVGPELSRWLGEPWGAKHPAMLLVVAFVALISNYAGIKLAADARRELVQLGRGVGGTKK